jgi:transposase, IS6 family
VDETYIKVRGQWKYLFRAIDKVGRTLDFYLSATRNAKAAKRFLAKALKRSKHDRPGKINTDKNPAYGEAIRELKKEGLLVADCCSKSASSTSGSTPSGAGQHLGITRRPAQSQSAQYLQESRHGAGALCR